MIKSYLSYRRFALFLFFSCFAVFAAIMLLAGVETQYILYAMLVSVFISAMFLFIDYFRYKSKLMRVRDIGANLLLTSPEFPDVSNDLEQAYTDIISGLYRRIRSENSRAVIENAELVDYYTMWLHQIKTPISAIYLASASKDISREIVKQELFKIEQYVEMALQYARLDRGIADLVSEKCALDDIITGVLKKYAALFVYKKLAFSYEKSDFHILTDRKWLSFIVEQLFSNAIKYTNEGSITISLNGNALCVSDTGIGIRAEDLKRVFERGYTGYNGRIDSKSSGLGLYMAMRAAEKIGVKLKIESEQGKGTRASICFPDELVL